MTVPLELGVFLEFWIFGSDVPSYCSLAISCCKTRKIVAFYELLLSLTRWSTYFPIGLFYKSLRIPFLRRNLWIYFLQPCFPLN